LGVGGVGRVRVKGRTMNEPNTTPVAKTPYFLIYLVIAGLIVLTVVLSFADLGDKRIFVTLAIAGAQACLLGYFFMHLKDAEQLTWLIAGAGLFWIFILFLFVLTDYLTRHIAVY
jgi:caa(3)-type oxidase subunit IV